VSYDGLADGHHGFEVRAADALGNTAAATTGFDVRRTVVTPTPTPKPLPRAAAPVAVARAVAKRLAGRTPAAVARLKPFRVRYRATSGGTLTVTVKLGRIGTVLRARSDASAARTLRPRVRRTAAARRLGRRTRATLTVLARFTPAKGKAVRATRRVTVRRR